MADKKIPYPKPQKLKKADGTIAHLWDGKLHNWAGPALIPEGNKKKREYYLYGIQYTEEDHKEAIKQQTGLPWFKQPTPKGEQHRH